MVNWSLRKQQTVTLSSTEAEYIALAESCQEALFMNSLLDELIGETNTAVIYEDNTGAIFLVKNKQVGARTKHIDVRHHFIRDLHDAKKVQVIFKPSANNSADIMTKNSTVKLFTKHAHDMQSGTLQSWREDVTDPSNKDVTEPSTMQTESVTTTQVLPIKDPDGNMPFRNKKKSNPKKDPAAQLLDTMSHVEDTLNQTALAGTSTS